jgi:hypothetical protein
MSGRWASPSCVGGVDLWHEGLAGERRYCRKIDGTFQQGRFDVRIRQSLAATRKLAFWQSGARWISRPAPQWHSAGLSESSLDNGVCARAAQGARAIAPNHVISCASITHMFGKMQMALFAAVFCGLLKWQS